MKILIATDGSEFSSAAVKELCRMMINPEDNEIKVVSAYEQPMMVAAAPYAMPFQFDENFDKQLREQARRTAVETEEQIRSCFPDLKEKLKVQVLCGAPGQAIVEEAEKWGADLIIVGTHGYGFWERNLLGSVSNSVIHHAPCSVLVVRKRDSDNRQNGKYKNESL